MNPNEGSAREMRASLKQSQSEYSKLRLFSTLGETLFQKGWTSKTAQQILSEICLQFGAEHGFIAGKDIDTLTVIARQGLTFPEGARIPMMGELATLLKPPCAFTINHQLNQLWSHQKTEALTPHTIPIAYAQKPVGILGFSNMSPTLSKDETATIRSLSGLLGLALMRTNNKPTNSEDQSVLNVLTPREREVFALLGSGKNNIELSALLNIAPGTVKIHVERILHKLGLRDRVQAAIKAVELGYST